MAFLLVLLYVAYLRLYVDENNASLIEAGFIRRIPSTCMLMKIMRRLNRSYNDARILSKIEAEKMKRKLLKIRAGLMNEVFTNEKLD